MRRSFQSIIVVTCIFNLAACSHRFRPVSANSPEPHQMYSFLFNATDELVFDAHVYFQKRHFSGLLFCKIEQDHQRILFTTKTGQQIWDVELKNKKFKVNDVIEELDKKLIIKTLEKDMRLLTWRCMSYEDIQYDTKSDVMHYRSRDCLKTGDWVHVYLERGGEFAYKTGIGGRHKPSRWLLIDRPEDGTFTKITIDRNSVFNLRYELFPLNGSRE